MCQEFIDEMPLEQHHRRVRVARNVEGASLETVDLIENIATPADVEAFSPLELRQIISTFGQYVSSEAESEAIAVADCILCSTQPSTPRWDPEMRTQWVMQSEWA